MSLFTDLPAKEEPCGQFAHLSYLENTESMNRTHLLPGKGLKKKEKSSIQHINFCENIRQIARFACVQRQERKSSLPSLLSAFCLLFFVKNPHAKIFFRPSLRPEVVMVKLCNGAKISHSGQFFSGCDVGHTKAICHWSLVVV